MNSNMALVIVVVLVLGFVIFLRVRDSLDRFEENAHKREYMQLWIEGFRGGLRDENLNNSHFVDDILKRMGYNGPEQLEALAKVQETPLGEEVIPPFIPAHEQDYILENLDSDGAREVEAQWGDPNLPND